MDSTTTSSSDAPLPGIKQSATRRQIRGSSLLLAGKFLAKGLNFAVQVLIVRYLSQADYGAFAYGLSVVHLGQSVALFGLDRAITRFVPIYHEQRDYGKLFGTLIMVVATIASLAVAIVLFFHGFAGVIAERFITDQQAFNLLLILIFLTPVEAIDELLIGMLAIFASPSAIFFRKNVLAPGLKLIVVLMLVLGNGSVFFLASGYVISGALGIFIYVVLLYRVMREQGIFKHFDVQSINIPWLAVFSFTIPLLTSDLVYILMNSVDVMLLERFRSTVDVAVFRAVHPTATLNQLVMASFNTLFTPLAARMFARNDREGINHLYWQTAIWIAVFSFPIFALTFSIAHPITVFLYGTRYEQSAIILALLSFGYYFNAALGFNGLTLKVYGKLRYVVVLNIVTAVANLGLNLLLIPRYGALGAAIGTTATLIIHNVLKQAGLRLGTGINLFEWRYFRVYVTIILGALGLLLFQVVTSVPVYFSIALAGFVSFMVLRLNRHMLNVSQTFPELLRLPLMRRLLGQ
jgi:O-antigen/teichoic acid export membrane protein